MVMFGCQTCGNVNRTVRRFCGSCGSLLGWLCPYCGFFNFNGEKFCGECGRVQERAGVSELQRRPTVAPPAHSPPGFGGPEILDRAPGLPPYVDPTDPPPYKTLPPGVEPVTPGEEENPSENPPTPQGTTLTREIKQYLQTITVEKEEEPEDQSGPVSQDDVNKLFG